MKQLICIWITCIVGMTSISQTNPTNDHIRQLLEVTGSGKLGIQVIGTMIKSFKKELPSVPHEFWDEFEKEVGPNDLVELLIPIYAKYYTDEEIIHLIEFYKTPLGQKVIEKLPLISQDSYAAGEAWGKKIGEKVLNRLKEKGYMQNN